MKVKGKQLEDTLRSSDSPFTTIYANDFVGSVDGMLRFKCKNGETSAITKGQAVYISGIVGEIPQVKLADADGTDTMPAVGLTEAGANASAEVYVVSFGNLTGLDTDTLNTTSPSESIVGRNVYVDTTAGGITITKPSGSGSKVQNIGQIVREHSSSGIIKVGGAGRTAATPNLDEGHFFVGDSNNQSTESVYQLPLAVGNANQVLTSDGTDVTFQDASSGGIQYTEVTADVTEANFAIGDMTIPYETANDITINLPTVKNEFTKSLTYDGERFIIDNKSQYTVTLKIAEAGFYNTSSSPKRYEQTYLRHSGNTDSTGVDTAGILLYEVRPMSSVEVEVYKFVNTAPSTDVYQIIYNVTLTGGMANNFLNVVSSSISVKPNNLYLVDTSGGAVTLTLPPSADVGDGERIEFKNVGTNDLVIDAYSSQKIENSATSFLTLSNYGEAVTLVKWGGSIPWLKLASL